LAQASYSTSKEERETIYCFLDFQEINDEPRSTQKLVMECWVSKQQTQLEIANVKSLSSEEAKKNKPLAGNPFK